MPANPKQILQCALALPDVERAAIVESLLASLDRPEAIIDESWAEEAEKRLAAFDAGRIKAIPAAEVFEERGNNLKRWNGETTTHSRYSWPFAVGCSGASACLPFRSWLGHSRTASAQTPSRATAGWRSPVSGLKCAGSSCFRPFCSSPDVYCTGGMSVDPPNRAARLAKCLRDIRENSLGMSRVFCSTPFLVVSDSRAGRREAKMVVLTEEVIASFKDAARKLTGPKRRE